MICEAVIGTALRGDGSTSLPTLGSTAPVKLMPTPDGVYIVGTAAAPLNGDRISLDIYVAPQTELTLRTVAASLAWPGTSPIPSQFTINARVGEGATLRWLPEPLVPVDGSRHRMVANVELAQNAELLWREEIVLGRHKEAPGELSSRLEITQPAGPLLRQEIVIGASHFDSPVVLGEAGATGTVTIAGREATGSGFAGFPLTDGDAEAAIHALETGGQQVAAQAVDSVQLRKLLDAGTRAVLENSSPTMPAQSRSEHAQLGN
jgi:urease accessory protein